MSFTAKQIARLETMQADIKLNRKQAKTFLDGLVKNGACTQAEAEPAYALFKTDAASIVTIVEAFWAIHDAQNVPESPEEVAQDVVEDAEEIPAASAPSLLAGLVGNMLDPSSVQAPNEPEAPAKVAEKTGNKIEPNRPEQNGLKRPSKGSTCCIIWDTCDRISLETGAHCTSALLFNALQGLNECTLRTQYARWRQFNGITGRLPGQNKASKLPAEFDDAKDAIMGKINPENSELVASLTAVKSVGELVAWIAANATSF